MEKISVLNRLISQPSEASFEKKKLALIVRVLVVSTIVIFAIETLLMLFLEFVLFLPDPLAMIVDGLALVLFLFPINYYFIVRPLVHQIDEHRQTNQELIKSNEILERFFSISDVLIAYMDTEFNFLRVNEAYSISDEHDPGYYVGKNHFDLFPNEENRAIFESVVKTGKTYYAVEKPFEYVDHPERGITYWDWSLMPVKDLEGQVIALIFVLTDVTARKRAQIALHDSERRLRAVFNQTFQHSALLDPAGNTRMVNQTALNFTGMTQEHVSGVPLWLLPWWDQEDHTSSGSANHLQQAVQQAAGGQTVRCEQRVKAADGEQSIMDITIKPLLDPEGKAVMLIYEARDITTRIKAEEALKHSEEKIMRLYEAEMQAHKLAETLRGAAVALSGSLDSEIVMETLLDHLFQVVPHTSAHILLLEDEEHLIVRLARGEEVWKVSERLLGKRYDMDSLALFRPLLTKREVISVPDTLLYPGIRFLPTDEYVRCWLGIPLLAGNQIIGVCMLEHECPDFFSEELIHWAEALTRQAAVAIQNAWFFEQVRDGRQQLQALSRRLVEVQESERRYIARELHDEAGQALASLMIGLRHLERENSHQPNVAARCAELKQMADGVLENLHRLAVDLRPATLDHLGLVAALRQHAESVSEMHGLTIQLEMVGKIERLSGEIETSVYRIVQEALTNVVRHACATRVDIILDRRDNVIVVVVEDNGVGFDLQSEATNHLGMVGMRERAEMLGGTITIESSAGNGSTIVLEVPCPSES